MTENDVLSAEDELDLSGDSAVEIVESVWTLTEAEKEETESDNGSGTRYNLVFQNQENPDREITMRFFVAYSPTDSNKSTDWVKRQRGQLKNVVKALAGEQASDAVAQVNAALTNPDSEFYLVGRQVKATTRDGGDGFAVLSKFRKIA